ncbi:MAG: KpsF/GutQ family sugar-phosphate isomerase [Bacteroidetes bacterium]|nr:KpsF/GutQ family sugar-phosphate isomerase [Bacteroidota bacterium]
MKTNQELLKIAALTISQEAETISGLVRYLDDDFTKAVELIYKSEGRVIITGIGKSANIASKIVATLNSTGTPAVFMHAADAIHGDLGIIRKGDIIICLSKSGNTPEIRVLILLIRNLGNPIIAITSDLSSFLAVNADLVLKAIVEKEACPNNIVPTSSTTAQLVLGDALAICLLEYRGFSKSDFARIHPGGTLGKKLYMRVSDIYSQNGKPRSFPADPVRKVIIEISSNRLGATAVVDSNDDLLGIITDGDLRRMLEKNDTIDRLTAKDIMTENPRTINCDEMAVKAYNVMEQNKITQLPVVENGKYLGIIHLHDILREGII